MLVAQRKKKRARMKMGVGDWRKVVGRGNFKEMT
jgi:hypothetical protein